MPKRPKQHQIEDLSRAKFQFCLPKEWVVRDKDKDYGIDCEVELFDKEEKTTGMLFYVQLKATSSINKSAIFNIDFKIETLEYFKQLEIPVLLARYSVHLDKFYIKWVNQVDLNFVDDNAKTFRIKISDDNKWNENSATQIENDLRNVRILKSGLFNFPISYSIDFMQDSIQGLSANQFKIQLRNELNKYSDFLEFKQNEENHLLKISVEKNTLLIQTSILRGVYLHKLENYPKENFINEISLDILLSLSICMVMIGQIDCCGKIVFENELENHLIERENFLLFLLPVLLDGSYFENSLDLVNNALSKKENEIILFPSLATVLLKSDTKNKKRIALIENFFKNQLEKSIDLKLKLQVASSHYNLGNFYRSKDEHYKAIHHYVQAKKYDSDYLKRSYFYKEIAGVCFLSYKFYFSSKFYEKSILLGASNETNSLLGDALMFSGKYKEAYKVFEEYITSTDEPSEEFLLKTILLKNIIQTKNISLQIRKPEEANKIAVNKPTLNDIELALEKDLLSSVAWFNCGLLKKDENDFQDATHCFAFCACIDLTDIEAWTFAFLSFINSDIKENILIGSLILKTAYWHNRDEFLSYLYQILEQSTKSNDEVFKIIDNILVDSNKVKKSSVIRILNGEDYKEIELRK